MFLGKDLPRSLVVQGLVRPFHVVEPEPGVDAFSGFPGRGILIEIDLFVFEASPETFREDVVCGPSFSVHTDLNVMFLEPIQIAWTGKMAPLITVPDRRSGKFQRSIHAVKDKGHLQGVVKLLSNDIAGIPVNGCHKVHPAFLEADVRNVDPPHMVRRMRDHVPEKIRVDPVAKLPFAEVGARMNPFDPHLSHGGLNPLSSHRNPFSPESNRDLPAPIEGVLGIDLIDPTT